MSGPPRPSPAVVAAESRRISWVMHSWRLLVSDTYMMFQSPVMFCTCLGDVPANDRLRDHGNMHATHEAYAGISPEGDPATDRMGSGMRGIYPASQISR
jgi:hypothetical protein